MEPARERLARALEAAQLNAPRCPIVQNVTATPETDPEVIRQNLIAQLTAPVRWTQTMQWLLFEGVNDVVEVGPGKVLQGLFKKVDRGLATASAVVA